MKCRNCGESMHWSASSWGYEHLDGFIVCDSDRNGYRRTVATPEEED